MSTTWQILLVDNNDITYLLTQELLKKPGTGNYRIDWVASYDEGQQSLLTNNYHAVLIGSIFPPLTAIDFIRDAIAQGCQSPLILFPEKEIPEEDIAAMEAGAAFYIAQQGITPVLLERAVRYAIQVNSKESMALQPQGGPAMPFHEPNDARTRRTSSGSWSTQSVEIKNEEQLRILASVVENSSNFIGIRTPDMQPFFLNDAGRRMVGLDQDADLRKTHVMDFFWPEDRAMIESQAVPTLLEEGRWSGAVRFIHFKTGKPINTMWNAFIIHDEDGTPIAWATISPDLTNLKFAEELLRLKEKQIRDQYAELDQIYRYAPVGLFTFDRDYRFMRINERMAEINGFPVEYHIGKTLDEIVPDLAAFLKEVYRPVLEKGEPVIEVEIHGETPKEPGIQRDWLGSYFPWYSGSGEIIGLIAAVQEVTERKRIQEALKTSEARFRQLADAMPHLVWTAEPNGIIDYFNQRYKDYDGIAPTDSVSWDWNPVLYPDDLQPTLDAWNRATETGEIYQIEHRARKSDGNYYWHLARALPVRDGQGNIIKWYGTATDIHEQKLIEEQLKRSNQELEQFALVASHDLQEPLRKVALFGNSLRKQLTGNLPEDANDSLTRMQKAADRMQTMIRQLLELSRVNTRGGSFHSADLTMIAHEVLSDLEPLVNASGGQVIIDPLPTAEVDIQQIRQLFQNLIGNALKFRKPSTPPVVRVSGKNDETRKSPSVCLVVEDNGIGFDEQYAERIFQPFQRLHGASEYEGTGMGLAICKRIVERHNGTIQVNSRSEEGTRFQIILPTNQPD